MGLAVSLVSQTNDWTPSAAQYAKQAMRAVYSRRCLTQFSTRLQQYLNAHAELSQYEFEIWRIGGPYSIRRKPATAIYRLNSVMFVAFRRRRFDYLK